MKEKKILNIDKSNDSSVIIERIKKFYKMKNDYEVAEYFGLSGVAVSNWRKRGINYDILLTKCDQTAVNYILYGSEPEMASPAVIDEVVQENNALRNKIAELTELLKKDTVIDEKGERILQAINKELANQNLEIEKLRAQNDILQSLILQMNAAKA